ADVTRLFFFFQAEDGIRDFHVTGVQTCALPISPGTSAAGSPRWTTPATGSAQKPHGQAPTSSGSGSTSPGRSASSPGPTPVADGRYRALLAERDRPVPPPPTPYPEGPSLWWARAQENTDDAED